MKLIYSEEFLNDLVFKGYTVPFRVSKDAIKILAIFKRNSHAMK